MNHPDCICGLLSDFVICCIAVRDAQVKVLDLQVYVGSAWVREEGPGWVNDLQNPTMQNKIDTKKTLNTEA
eukprot:1160706-Pelagomonas_calceolata.AAC.3